jgi:hypothetical protein
LASASRSTLSSGAPWKFALILPSLPITTSVGMASAGQRWLASPYGSRALAGLGWNQVNGAFGRAERKSEAVPPASPVAVWGAQHVLKARPILCTPEELIGGQSDDS